MARLYALQGILLRLLQTDEEFDAFGEPEQWDDLLDFDAETNGPVVQGVLEAWDEHRLSAGVLERDGQVVAIEDPGESYLARKQAAKVQEALRDLLAGLGQIENVVDFGYAYKARLLAKANGESLATIQAIVDRQTASQYVAGMSQFQALPAAVRQWLAVELESQAYDAMVIRLLLT
jgi:hypothetical protein